MTDFFDCTVSARKTFGIDRDIEVPAFHNRSPHVPEVDPSYCFDPETTLAVIAGFAHNRRVLIQGAHGSGKSTHVEQVAARLNWPCMRVNLDGHVSRFDLIGKDMITLDEGQTVTAFMEGILPWSMQRPMALVFDEYDAARPDVMFVIQRVLEADGKLILPDQSRVLQHHPGFRLFATANTIGLGDTSGLYHGTQQINQGQLDRWHITANLNYLPHDKEVEILLSRLPALNHEKGAAMVRQMVSLANLVRQGFMNQDLSTVMSLRTVVTWAENVSILGDIALAFRYSFFNRCDETERPTLAEYYQRCFNEELFFR